MRKIRCPKCDGKGKIDLPEEYAQAFALVTKHPGRTTEFYAPKAKATKQAMSMRLQQLVRWEILNRWREGRYFHYTTKRNPTKP